jgi:dienelactone hydrolase
MTTVATNLDYYDGDTLCKGVYFSPQNPDGNLPVVLVVHAWDGLIQEVRDKASKLAEAGFIAFAIDVYGNGQTWSDFSMVQEVLTPVMSDRPALLKRLEAALTAAADIPGADPARIGAMGYCFGGLCVLDMARGCNPALGPVVSFHGALLPTGAENSTAITSPVLVLHGHDDPMIPPEQVNAFMTEMTERQADWQLVSYSNTVHAFTRPDANMPEVGAVYNAQTDRRSWTAMLDFFAETL